MLSSHSTSAGSMPAPPIFQTYLVPPSPFRRPRFSLSLRRNNTSTSSLSPSAEPKLSPPTYLPCSPTSTAASHISCAHCLANLALTSQIISKGFTGRHGRAYLVAATPSVTLSGPTVSCSTQALPNTHTHKAQPRNLVTGMHTVQDVSCAVCGSNVGWKYLQAEDEGQRYKVGKFILETKRVVVLKRWEDHSSSAARRGLGSSAAPAYTWSEPAAAEDSSDSCSEDEAALREEEKASLVELGAATTGLRGLGLGGSGSGGGNGMTSTIPDEEIMFDSQDEDECEDLFAGVWSPALARRRRGKKRSLLGGGLGDGSGIGIGGREGQLAALRERRVGCTAPFGA